MMRVQRPVSVDLNDADPTEAINVFLHVMAKQRSLGLMPRSEHMLAEHLLRGDAKVIFYSNSNGLISLVEGGEIDLEDAHETMLFILEKRKARAIRERETREALAASAIEARSAETEGLGPQGESAAPKADAETQGPDHVQ